MSRLPNRLIPIKNPDKKFHEKWHTNRSLLNFPHPFRAVFLGPPNCGKTTTVKNILVRAHPPFQEVFVIHCDPNYTEEYDDVDCDISDSIPAPDEWKGKVKTLVILDDLEFKLMDRVQLRNLDRLFGFVSTHKNISVCLCSQDCFNIPPIVRRCSNLWVIWRITDMDALSQCARRTSLKSRAFRQIFEDIMDEPKDSLWIDLTDKSPMKLRKNGFMEIKLKEEE